MEGKYNNNNNNNNNNYNNNNNNNNNNYNNNNNCCCCCCCSFQLLYMNFINKIILTKKYIFIYIFNPNNIYIFI